MIPDINLLQHITQIDTEIDRNSILKTEKHFHSSTIDSSTSPTMVPLAKRQCTDPVGSSSGLPKGISALTVENSVSTLRSSIGGKGLHLEGMKRLGLPVPPFYCISTEMLVNINKDPAIRDEIKKHYRELCGPDSEKAVIVRSSGVLEDDYGDAQAGRYHSEVHGPGDIIDTCRRVMASGCDNQPGSQKTEETQPMAIILQEFIDCRAGGVIMSYSSLQDERVLVEYGPGQPRGAVAGVGKIQPHRHRIDRDQSKPPVFEQGNIASMYDLKKDEHGGFRELVREGCQGIEDYTLNKAQLTDILQYCRQLEARLLCPVDIEFGIDRNDQVILFQVRPVVSLIGGTNYTISAPENLLLKGIPLSDGCVSGDIYSHSQQPGKTVTIPRKGIVLAEHMEQWMVEPTCLEHISGFALRECGINSHVAINLRQLGIPCVLLPGEQWLKAKDLTGSVTLVCGTFNQQPGAFLLRGNQLVKLQDHRCEPIIMAAKTLFPVRTDKSWPVETLSRTDTAFQWLTCKNNELLDYFAPNKGISRCMAEPISLTMNPDGVGIVINMKSYLTQQFEDLAEWLAGYEAYLGLAKEPKKIAENRVFEQLYCGDDSFSSIVNELQPLRDQLRLIEREVKEIISSIIESLSSSRNIMLPAGKHWNGISGDNIGENNIQLEQWLQKFADLKSRTVALNQPVSIKQIRSVNDLIAWVHRRIIITLPMVASYSGHDSTCTPRYNYVNFCSPDDNSWMNEQCRAVLQKLKFVETVVINMAGALILNIRMGAHVTVIEMLEQAENSKVRTLRFRYCEGIKVDCTKKESGHHRIRLWFLTQLLINVSSGTDFPEIDICHNLSNGSLVAEVSNMTTRDTMVKLLDRFVSVVSCLRNLDNQFILYPMPLEDSFYAGNNNPLTVFSETTAVLKAQKLNHSGLLSTHSESKDSSNEKLTLWNLNILDKKMTNYFTTEIDKSAFVRCLIITQLVGEPNNLLEPDILTNEFRFIAHCALSLREKYCNKIQSSQIKEILSKEDEHLRKEILYHLLMIKPRKVLPLVRSEYDWVEREDIRLHLIRQNPKLSDLLNKGFNNNKTGLTHVLNDSHQHSQT